MSNQMAFHAPEELFQHFTQQFLHGPQIVKVVDEMEKKGLHKMNDLMPLSSKWMQV